MGQSRGLREEVRSHFQLRRTAFSGRIVADERDACARFAPYLCERESTLGCRGG